MNEISKGKLAEYQILNRNKKMGKRKENIKMKNININLNKKRKLLLFRRPKSNYLPKQNKILEQGKMSFINNNENISQIKNSSKKFVNKMISTNDLNENNSLSFINNVQSKIKNYINEEHKKEIDKSKRILSKEYKTPKSAKHELKISKSFLNDKIIFNKNNNRIIKRGLKGFLSPRNDFYRNKYSELTKDLFSKINYNYFNRPNSPSTTINSNIYNDNSYSSHFLFGISSFNSNVYSKIFDNTLMVETKLKNKEKKENKPKTAYGNNSMRKLLAKKEIINKNKNNQIKNKTNNFLYHIYGEEKNKKETNLRKNIINIPLNSNKNNKIKTNLFESNHSMSIIKSVKFNSERKGNKNKIKEKNKNKNTIKTKKNENPNLIIKYAFLDKAINKIMRKVDFINPKNGEQIKLATANVNNGNKEEKKIEDFTTYGYEMSPEEIYKLYQKSIQKNKNEEKKINLKLNISQYNINKRNEEDKKYRKIEIKKLDNKEEAKNNEDNEEEIEKLKKRDFAKEIKDIINMNSFGLGDILKKNRIDYNKINEEDKEEGKQLWLKLSKSVININAEQLKKKDNTKNTKLTKRIKSANINKKINIKKSKLKNKEKQNNKIIHFKRRKKRHFTIKINTLKVHKVFRREKGFNKLKKNTNKIHKLEFKKTEENEEEDEEEETINEVMSEQNKKKEEKKDEKQGDQEDSNIDNSNISKRRNSATDIGLYDSKLFKVKRKKSKKEKYKIKYEVNDKELVKKLNKEIEKEKEKLKRKEMIKANRLLNITNINKFNEKQKLIMKNKYEKEIFIIKKEMEKKQKQKEKKVIDNSLNILKNKSMEIDEDKMWNKLYHSFDSESEDINFSFEKNLDENEIKFETLNIRGNNKKKPTLLFDKFLKNFKWKYKEDDKMNKYFDEIFNKYDDDDQLIDITFFGFHFKIKKKNRNNFRNILMKNIREKNENRIIFTKLGLILDKFKNNKKKTSRAVFNSLAISKRHEKIKKLKKLREEKEKRKEKEKEIEKEQKEYMNIKEEEDEEYKTKLFKGIKKDSIKEVEKKKEEILSLMEDDIKFKIMKGEMGHTELDHFLNFQKRMNAYQLDYKSKNFIKLLEQEFISFEEELKIKEQKKKEEKRLNNFVNDMYYDLQRNFYMKKAQKQLFCNVVDYSEMNNINLLSPTNKIYFK